MIEINKKRITAVSIFTILLIISFCIYKSNLSLQSYVGCLVNNIKGKTLNKDFKYKIKSGDLSTDYKIEQVLKDIDKFKFNTINIPIVINIKDLSSSDMNIDENSKEKAINLIKKLSDKNINIILEAYPWIDNGEKYETEWNPKDKNKFFYNWENKVLNKIVKDVAIPYHVDVLNVASNFVYMEDEEDKWCKIIDSIRKDYKGLVTYKTCWWVTAKWDKKTKESYEKKLNNKIFSKVDFISIAAYFELTENNVNSVENIISAINKSQIYNRNQNIKMEIEKLHKKWGKPIFFGELGFPNREYASFAPWNSESSDIINNLEQANCFEAYRKTFKDEWFLGFSVFAVGETGSDKHYYPRKESEKIIREWFEKENIKND